MPFPREVMATAAHMKAPPAASTSTEAIKLSQPANMASWMTSTVTTLTRGHGKS